MPKFNKQTDTAIIDKEQKTSSGITVSAGEIEHSDWDKKDWRELQQDYVNMLNGCPVISTTWKLIEYPLMQSAMKINVGKSKSDKSKEAVDYLYWCFDNIHKGTPYLKRHKLKAILYGCAFHEVIKKRADKYEFVRNGVKTSKITNRIVKLSPIQNDTINKFFYKPSGDFEGIKHEKRTPAGVEKNYKNENINILADKLHWMTFNEEYDDIRGQSILRPVRYYYEAGQKILQAKVLATQRGAGIVGIRTIGKLSAAEKTELEKIGRTIASMSNGYFLIDKERAEIVLEELKAQQDIMPLLQFINRMKFYNTMSQFLTAGIGESGSRAATIEHKAPYELALNHTNKELEENFQNLSNYMLDLSYLQPLAEEDIPEVTFTAITQADMLREAQIYKQFYDAGLQLTDIDWNIIREHLNLPAKELEVVDKQTLPGDQEAKQLSRKPKERIVKPEIIEFEHRIFELSSANEHYMTVGKKTDDVIKEMLKKLFADIAKQLKIDRKKDIDMRFGGELVKRLSRIYEEAYNRGEVDVKKEVNKLKGGKTELSLDPSDKKEIKSDINKYVNRMYTNVKTRIETDMNKLTDTALTKKGGIDGYVLDLEMGFDYDKRALIQEIEGGYVNGRGGTLFDLAEDIETYLYSAVMDKDVCEQCAPLDSLIFTLDELQAQGLQLTAPVNPDCLGGADDRCQIMAYTLKMEE